MRCDESRAAISARLDHEETGFPEGELDRHVRDCAECSAYLEGAGALHRAMRVRPAEAVPDLTDAIMAAAPATTAATGRASVLPAPRGQPVSWRRWALLAVALTHLALAVPAVLLGADASLSGHLAREAGAWDMALSLALLLAAWHPARASGLLPMAVPLAVILTAIAVVDLTQGRTTAGAESLHVLEVAGVLLLWRIARRDGDTRAPRLVGRPVPRLA
jgi:predicted anti-sigma-YlaC factor YlaD